MKLQIISPGNAAPDWINSGFQTYAKRITSPFSLFLTEIPTKKFNKNLTIEILKEQEAEKILARTKTKNKLVALDIAGIQISTQKFAANIQKWQQTSPGIDFMIGGANGLSQACLQKADTIWSLSKLTFPHLLVRILLAEQIYRAISILKCHPYHRD